MSNTKISNIQSKKTILQNQRDFKYLRALQSLKEMLDNGKQVNLTGWARDNKLNLRVCKVLLDKKIILNLGTRPRPCYQWVSIPPNLKMVDALVVEMLRLNRLHGSKPKDKKPNNTIVVPPRMFPNKVRENKPTIEHRVIEKPTQKSINILWGLINIKF